MIACEMQVGVPENVEVPQERAVLNEIDSHQPPDDITYSCIIFTDIVVPTGRSVCEIWTSHGSESREQTGCGHRVVHVLRQQTGSHDSSQDVAS